MAEEVAVLEKPTETPKEVADTSLLDKAPETKADAPADKKPTEASTEKKTTESLLDKPTEVKKEAAVAPEKYAPFKAPDGIAMDEKVIEKFDAECKALNIPQDKRDAILQMQVEHTQTEIQKTMDTFNQQIADWTAETKKELGPNTEKALAVASKGIDTAFPDPAENKAFRDMMKETGLGNWKLMVKLVSHIGKLSSEDKLVAGKPAGGERKSNAEVLFDHPDSQRLK